MQYTLFTDSLLENNAKKLNYAIENHLLTKGLKPISTDKIIPINSNEIIVQNTFLKSENHILFKNTLLCINHTSHIKKVDPIFKIRLLLLDKIQKNNLIQLDDYDHIILNTRKNNKYSEKNSMRSKQLKYKAIHSLMEDGFFTIDIQ
jgi:hypothetical protein